MAEVREATAGDIDGAATALVSAFSDDPVMSYMFRKENKLRKLRRLMVSEQKRALKIGSVHTTADGVPKGAAIWMAPGKWKTGGLELLGQMPLMFAMGLETFRALGVLTQMEKIHPEEPHWYLAVLGTAKEHQGKGVGSALIQPILTTCDEEGIPAYLESSKAQNIPFYERHGFRVTGEVNVKDGPTLWPMWRDPQPPET
jgi:ribosomal protein S18 acetylase RimI-like enzyme